MIDPSIMVVLVRVATKHRDRTALNRKKEMVLVETSYSMKLCLKNSIDTDLERFGGDVLEDVCASI